MIIGIGTDVIQIPRIEKLYQKYGEQFLYKNYHILEIEIFHQLNQQKKILFLAKRFAGKEAVSKAFGTGIGKEMNFKDIAIINNDFGAPMVKISTQLINHPANYHIDISLSDDYPIALAFAIISI